MKIAVLGLGNVGLVAALGLCEQGHKVVGVEINQSKIDLLKNGQSYLYENGLNELIKKHSENIVFTSDLKDSKSCDVFMICVGTPTSIEGSIFLGQVVATISHLAQMLVGEKKKTIILRSTIPPGTIKEEVLPILDKSKINYELIYHPEFLREGCAVKDFLYPDIHVIGLERAELEISCEELFTNAPILKKVSYSAAEMLKYLNNSFHALKVSFINEVASIARGYDVNVDELVDCFLSDKKLNVSEKYLRPGFAFGGPCLVKDVRGLNFLSQNKNIKAPLVDSILKSNEAHLMRVLKKINKINPQNILLFGMAFKEGTNDLRSSPILDLINLLHKVPSYIPKKNIYLKETDLVKNEAKDTVDCIILEDGDDFPKGIDLIIIGAYRLNELDLNFCNNFEGPIIDLGFGVNNIKNDRVFIAYES